MIVVALTESSTADDLWVALNSPQCARGDCSWLILGVLGKGEACLVTAVGEADASRAGALAAWLAPRLVAAGAAAGCQPYGAPAAAPPPRALSRVAPADAYRNRKRQQLQVEVPPPPPEADAAGADALSPVSLRSVAASPVGKVVDEAFAEPSSPQDSALLRRKKTSLQFPTGSPAGPLSPVARFLECLQEPSSPRDAALLRRKSEFPGGDAAAPPPPPFEPIRPDAPSPVPFDGDVGAPSSPFDAALLKRRRGAPPGAPSPEPYRGRDAGPSSPFDAALLERRRGAHAAPGSPAGEPSSPFDAALLRRRGARARLPDAEPRAVPVLAAPPPPLAAETPSRAAHETIRAAAASVAGELAAVARPELAEKAGELAEADVLAMLAGAGDGAGAAPASPGGDDKIARMVAAAQSPVGDLPDSPADYAEECADTASDESDYVLVEADLDYVEDIEKPPGAEQPTDWEAVDAHSACVARAVAVEIEDAEDDLLDAAAATKAASDAAEDAARAVSLADAEDVLVEACEDTKAASDAAEAAAARVALEDAEDDALDAAKAAVDDADRAAALAAARDAALAVALEDDGDAILDDAAEATQPLDAAARPYSTLDAAAPAFQAGVLRGVDAARVRAPDAPPSPASPSTPGSPPFSPGGVAAVERAATARAWSASLGDAAAGERRALEARRRDVEALEAAVALEDAMASGRAETRRAVELALRDAKGVAPAPATDSPRAAAARALVEPAAAAGAAAPREPAAAATPRSALDASLVAMLAADSDLHLSDALARAYAPVVGSSAAPDPRAAYPPLAGLAAPRPRGPPSPRRRATAHEADLDAGKRPESAAAKKRRERKKKAFEASPDGLWERAWLASDGASGAVASVDRPYLSVSQLTQECLEAAGSSLVPKKRPPPPPRPAPKLSERPPPRHNAYAAAVTASSSPFRQAKHRAKHAAPPPPPAPDVVRHQLNVGAIYGAFEDRLIQNDDALKRILAKSEKLVRPSP